MHRRKTPTEIARQIIKTVTRKDCGRHGYTGPCPECVTIKIAAAIGRERRREHQAYVTGRRHVREGR